MIGESTTRRVLRYLLASGPRTAELMRPRRLLMVAPPISPAWGGGDYWAIMTEGRKWL